MKIRGNTIGTTMKRPDFNQTDPKKSDYIKNNPIPRLTKDDDGKMVRVENGNYVLSKMPGTLDGCSLTVDLNTSNYVMTVTLKDSKGNVVAQDTVDFPCELIVDHGYYDEESQDAVLVLANGNELRIPLDAISEKLLLNSVRETENDGVLLNDVEANYIGCRGYYWSKIDLSTDTPVIVLQSDRTTPPIIGEIGSWDRNEYVRPEYEVGDILVINNIHYYGQNPKILSISDNYITVDMIPFDAINSRDDWTEHPAYYSVFCPDKPNVGIEFGRQAQTAMGVGTKAEGSMAVAEGYQTIAYGDASHTEGIQTMAGYSAHAEGQETIASGVYSHAEGQFSKATDTSAHAEGHKTEASKEGSHSEGIYSKALGLAAHSEGYQTEAYGSYSHAEGQNTKATGTGAHAEGEDTQADANDAHAEGAFTKALGVASHSEGNGSEATNEATHAEGRATKAKGKYSHTEGESTETHQSYGYAAHAQGVATQANHRASHAEGEGTVTGCSQQHVQGKWNRQDNNQAHIIGGGTSASDRKNIHTVDWNGNAWYAGRVKSSIDPYYDDDLVNLKYLKDKLGAYVTQVDALIGEGV